MSVTSKLKRGVDLPMWEWLRPLQIITSQPSTFAAGGKPAGRYIYYLPLTTNIPWRYDTYADGWTALTSPPFSQTTLTATTYNEKQGYQGRIISIPSSTSFKAAVPKGNKCVGKIVKIISGTGAGQRRTITAVSAPIVHDTLSLTSANTVILVDANKNYAINQWRDYGARIISNTLSDFRKIIHNINNTLTLADNQFASVGLQWAYSPLPATAAPSVTDSAETRVQIESYDVTVDSAWTITPNNTSVFVIESGVLWNLNVVVARFGFQSYDILSDSWIQNNSINAGMLAGNIGTDVAMDTFAETGSALVTRPALSATAMTVKLSGSTFNANIYSNYNMRVTAGTGFGQTRTIMSHTSSNDFTLNRALSTTLDATSVVDIVVDNDKLFMTGSAAASMFEFDAVENIWSDRRVIEVGCPSNICAVWPGFNRPIGITSITLASTLATVTTTNPHGLVTGDSVTIFGTTLAAYNITATITVLTSTTFTYTMASGSASPAVAANSQSTTQLVDPCKNWVVNEHVGKIITYTTSAYTATGGLQSNYNHRVIASNTATTITFVAGTAPVANTTTYMITDVRANGGVVSGIITSSSTTVATISSLNMPLNIYAGLRAVIMDGGNWAEVAVTTNTATTISFTPAIGFTPTANASSMTILGVAPTGAGVGLNFLYNTTQLQRGRYMFGLRGAATNYMYLYDCAANTWDILTQTPNAETFAAGTMIAYDGNDRVYIQRDSTGRVLYYDIIDNNLYSYNVIPYVQGGGQLGNKMSILAGEDNVKFLYMPRHNATEFWRSLLWI
jgi:hypothetical protein